MAFSKEHRRIAELKNIERHHGFMDVDGATIQECAEFIMTPVEATVAYDEATMSLTVSVTGISSAASLRIEIPGGLRIADNPVESDAMDLLLHAQMLYRTKELALQAVHKLGIGAIGALRTMNRGPRYANDFWITDMPDAVAGALEEILLRS